MNCWVSRLVVPKYRRRPPACASATCLQQRLVDDPGDDRLQRPGIGERLARQQPPKHGPADEDVLRAGRGVELAQRRVMLRPEERERRHQRAGRHSGDDLEHRALAGCRPAVQEPGPECAVGAAAGDREQRIANDAVGAGRKIQLRILREGQCEIALHGLAFRARHGPDVRLARQRRFGREFRWHRVALQRGAAGQRRDRNKRHPSSRHFLHHAREYSVLGRTIAACQNADVCT